jgi:hypothetical protein
MYRGLIATVVNDVRANREVKLAEMCQIDFYSAGLHYRKAGEIFRRLGKEHRAKEILAKSSKSFEHEALARAAWTGIISAAEGDKEGKVRIEEVAICLREAAYSAEFADQIEKAQRFNKLAENISSGESLPDSIYRLVRG